MATRSGLDSYVAEVRYRWIDVDKVFGAQCWDQWSHYATNFLGVPSWPTYTNAGGTHPHAGYACNVHHNARAAGLEQWFVILPANAAPRPGDVAVWEFGSVWYPLSHIATVLAVLANGMLRCLTQNPGAVQVADLIPRGIIGYLRPRTLIAGEVNASKTPTRTASEKEEAMSNNLAFVAHIANGTQYNMIANSATGFCHEFESSNGEYNTNIARTFGISTPSSIVSLSHYDRLRADCAAMRAQKM